MRTTCCLSPSLASKYNTSLACNMRITPSRLITRDLTANKVIKRGSFRSKQDLPDKLTAFIGYFNTTLAKLFKWTYLV